MIIENLTGLLKGQPVFLKIPHGEKGPRLKGWQKMTPAKMSQDYIKQLNSERFNIGVLLGAASGGLCSIDIDNDEAVEPFLELNPRLRETLMTKGARGANLWIRIQGDYPKLSKLTDKNDSPWGEFRSDGGQTVIFGSHPSGKDYEIVNETPVIEIAFDEIVWPENLNLPWRSAAAVDPRPDAESDFIAEFGAPIQVTDKGGVAFNQGAIAEILRLENLLIFEPSERNFYRYEKENGLWVRMTSTQLSDLVEQTIRKLVIDNGYVQGLPKITANLVESVVRMLTPKIEVAEAFDRQGSIVHLKNCVVDLGQSPPAILEFHPDFNSRNQIPVDYVEGAVCPRFISEFLKPCLNSEDVALLQRVMGSFLLPANLGQAIFLITGAASSGKSTFVSLVEQLIGETNVHELRTEHLGSRFETQFYVGKCLLTGKDVPASFLQESGAKALKKLVGGDRFNAEKKGSNEKVAVRGEFHVIVTANSKLTVALEGDSEAWARRLILFEWARRPAGSPRIPKFDEVLLREEGPGILNWMLEGAVLHLEELKAQGSFQLTEGQRRRVQDMLDESNSVRAFVREVLVARRGQSVGSENLVTAYQEYCLAKGIEPMSNHHVQRQLPDLIYERFGISRSNDLPIGPAGSHRRGYHNLTLIDNEAQQQAAS